MHLLTNGVFVFSSFTYFFLFLILFDRLSWLSVSFSAHVKYFISYRRPIWNLEYRFTSYGRVPA